MVPAFGGAEAVLIFRLLKGVALPRTELSGVDAYVKVRCGSSAWRTPTVKDCQSPAWNLGCVTTVPINAATRAPDATIEFELFDEDLLKDKHLGSARLPLGALPASQLGYVELPLTWAKDKYNQGPSRLVVSVEGWVASFATLMAQTKHIPGALFNLMERRAYLPLPLPEAPPGTAYLAVEYEAAAVDFKVFTCLPSSPLFFDLTLTGRQHTKVRRRLYPGGKPVMPGLVAFEEIKLDDVPLSTDFSQLLLLAFDKRLLWSGSCDRIVSAAGWRGSLSFPDACRTLHSVDIDHKEQEVYFRVFDDSPGAAMAPPEALLLVDWDKNDVDIKLAVLDCPANLDKAWDLTIAGQDVKKTSEIFVPPRPKLGGKYAVSRLFELDDCAYGTSLVAITLHKWQLSNQRQWSVAQLLPLR